MLCELADNNVGGFQTGVDHLQVFLELERAGSHDLELLLKSSDAAVIEALHTRRCLTGVCCTQNSYTELAGAALYRAA